MWSVVWRTLTVEDADREMAQLWVDTWKRAGPALQQVKRQELREYDYAKDRDLIDGMLQWACAHGDARPSSGLVEQQRLFVKMREALIERSG